MHRFAPAATGQLERRRAPGGGAPHASTARPGSEKLAEVRERGAPRSRAATVFIANSAHALLLKLRPESDKTAGNFPLSLRRQRDTLREDVDERRQRRDELRRGGRGGGVAGLQRQQHCERVLRAVLLVEGARRACDRRLPRKGLRAQRGAGDRWGGGGLGWRGGAQSGGAHRGRRGGAEGAQSGRSAGAARACVRRACGVPARGWAPTVRRGHARR